jgi:hypothetical protein
VSVFCDDEQIAGHARSWMRADVVIAGAHARELWLAREVRRQLQAGDVDVAEASLSVYDELAG